MDAYCVFRIECSSSIDTLAALLVSTIEVSRYNFFAHAHVHMHASMNACHDVSMDIHIVKR